jgi:hypothetical protein
MGTQIGIATRNFVPAGVTATSNITLATVPGLTQNVTANKQWYFRFWIPFSVGATGGVAFQVLPPIAPLLFLLTWRLYQFGAPGTLLDTGVQTNSAPFANAAAGAGDNYMEAELSFINGIIPGTVELQFAQNTSDALTLTILKGGLMDIIQF